MRVQGKLTKGFNDCARRSLNLAFMTPATAVAVGAVAAAVRTCAKLEMKLKMSLETLFYALTFRISNVRTSVFISQVVFFMAPVKFLINFRLLLFTESLN